MNETSKTLHFGDNIPVQMHLKSTIPQAMHWHNFVELYYVLDGTLKISVLNQQHCLTADQLLVVNPFVSHAVLEAGATLAIFTIDLAKYDQHVLSPNVRFDCNSVTSSNDESLAQLKRVLARFVKNNVAGHEGKELINKSLSYELLHILVSDFSTEESLAGQSNSLQAARMEDILQYTNEHYAEGLSLTDLANRYYLTVPYMSKFFKTMMGTTFTDYMNDIRLSHVLNDLPRTDLSTEQLAETHGFPNTKSLVSLFKKRYRVTPAQYKRQLINAENFRENLRYNDESLETAHTSHLSILSQYLNSEATDITTMKHRYVKTLPTINVSNAKGKFVHTFQKSTSIGRAKEILFSENQKILKHIQEKVGFEYLGFHGLLDDEMMLYSEDINGNPELSFSLIDATFDFLKSIKLKPILELSFMPKALASNQQHPAYYTGSIISLPYDVNKWNYMIRGLMNHLMDRYGDEEVITWPIYLWSTPDLDTTHLGEEGLDDYNKLYYETWKTIKSCNPMLQVGAPNFINRSMEDGKYLSDFISFARTNNCMPDFLCMNYFSMSDSQAISNLSQTQTNMLLQSSPNAFSETLDKVNCNLENLRINHLPLYICEWNSSISHRELLNDTVFKSAYIVKNLLENHNRFHSVTYWALSDLLEEVKLSGNQFHGGLGLFTFDGMPKASYYAYELLAQLGDQLVASGDGFFMTRSTSEWQILLYNYHHYSNLYASGELFDMTPTNRYTPFDITHTQKFVIPLENIPDGNYTLSETIVNREHGSSFDKWVELGAETLVDYKEQQYLSSSSIPKMTRKVVAVENTQLIISRELEPHEVRLIKIRRHYTT